MKPTFGLQNTGLNAANKSDDAAMTPASSPTADDAPADVESKAEGSPSKKRGTFLPFFGKDRGPAIQPDGKPNAAEPPGGVGETGSPSPVSSPTDPVITNPAPGERVEPEPLTSKLALTALSTPPATPATLPPRPFMPSRETARLPDNGQALAELTIGFEVVSLQLTPYFKPGSLQLRSISNAVSLHLVAAKPDGTPLAAGISFQIEQVELDDASHFRSLVLKPLGELRAPTAPRPSLQVDHVAMTNLDSGAPIAVTASAHATTAVQVFGSFAIAEIEFTPAFEIGSLRLTPASNRVRVRVSPTSPPTTQDLPLSFEIAEVEVGDGVQTIGVRLLPVTTRNA